MTATAPQPGKQHAAGSAVPCRERPRRRHLNRPAGTSAPPTAGGSPGRFAPGRAGVSFRSGRARRWEVPVLVHADAPGAERLRDPHGGRPGPPGRIALQFTVAQQGADDLQGWPGGSQDRPCGEVSAARNPAWVRAGGEDVIVFVWEEDLGLPSREAYGGDLYSIRADEWGSRPTRRRRSRRTGRPWPATLRHSRVVGHYDIATGGLEERGRLLFLGVAGSTTRLRPGARVNATGRGRRRTWARPTRAARPDQSY